MKNLKHIFLLSWISILLSTPAYALASGQIDFADLSSYYGEPKVEVNLTASLMNLVGRLAQEDDPEVGEILSNLESIKVRVYNLNGKLEKASTTIDQVSSRLRNDQWETLVKVNDNEENQKVRIFSKSTDDVIDGVVVMVVSPEKEEGEAVFINIVGQIDLDKIGKVTESLDIDLN